MGGKGGGQGLFKGEVWCRLTVSPGCLASGMATLSLLLRLVNGTREPVYENGIPNISSVCIVLSLKKGKLAGPNAIAFSQMQSVKL